MGYELAGDMRLFLVGGFVRVMDRGEFNFVAMSLGHCMINLDTKARGYRQGKSQQIYKIQCEMHF